jgi:hypothetical protein
MGSQIPSSQASRRRNAEILSHKGDDVGGRETRKSVQDSNGGARVGGGRLLFTREKKRILVEILTIFT